jgi:hypothetical protein
MLDHYRRLSEGFGSTLMEDKSAIHYPPSSGGSPIEVS